MNYITRPPGDLPEEVKGAVCLSTPINMEATLERLSSGMGKWYGKLFLAKFKKMMREKERAYPGTYDLKKVAALKDLGEFDRNFNRVWHGFSSVSEFYAYMDPRPYLDKVRVPVLLVNALDDPFMDSSCFPKEVASKNSLFHLESPVGGGHIGFSAMDGKEGSWADRRTFDFMQSVMARE